MVILRVTMNTSPHNTLVNPSSHWNYSCPLPLEYIMWPLLWHNIYILKLLLERIVFLAKNVTEMPQEPIVLGAICHTVIATQTLIWRGHNIFAKCHGTNSWWTYFALSKATGKNLRVVKGSVRCHRVAYCECSLEYNMAWQLQTSQHTTESILWVITSLRDNIWAICGIFVWGWGTVWPFIASKSRQLVQVRLWWGWQFHRVVEEWFWRWGGDGFRVSFSLVATVCGVLLWHTLLRLYWWRFCLPSTFKHFSSLQRKWKCTSWHRHVHCTVTLKSEKQPQLINFNLVYLFMAYYWCITM